MTKLKVPPELDGLETLGSRDKDHEVARTEIMQPRLTKVNLSENQAGKPMRTLYAAALDQGRSYIQRVQQGKMAGAERYLFEKVNAKSRENLRSIINETFSDEFIQQSARRRRMEREAKAFAADNDVYVSTLQLPVEAYGSEFIHASTEVEDKLRSGIRALEPRETQPEVHYGLTMLAVLSAADDYRWEDVPQVPINNVPDTSDALEEAFFAYHEKESVDAVVNRYEDCLKEIEAHWHNGTPLNENPFDIHFYKNDGELPDGVDTWFELKHWFTQKFYEVREECGV